MSLRRKIVLILVMVVSVYAITDQLVQRYMVWPSFLALEQEEAKEDMQRVSAAIESRIVDLKGLCTKWATWDDTFAFVADKNTRFIESNLGKNVFASDDLDLLYICDVEGRVVWGKIASPGDRSTLSLRDFPSGALATSHPLLWTPSDAEAAAIHRRTGGVYVTERGPLLVSFQPIRMSSGDGEPRGTVITGRFLSSALVRELTDQTRVAFEFWPLDDPEDLPASVQGVRSAVEASLEPLVRDFSDNRLHVYTAFQDIQAAPALLLRANVGRNISRTGSTSLSYASRSTIAAALIILLVQVALIQRTVLTPLSALTRHAVAIGQTEDVHAKLELDRDDEVGVLSREFDNMMTKLAQSRAAVIDSARSAGMSEIATGILHNVGNVLNSVNVSAAMLADKVNKLPVSDLDEITEVLKEHSEDLASFLSEDPKGKHLQPYLASLSELLGEEQESINKEVVSLTSGIEHIRSLITAQQNFARRGGFVESTSLAEKFDEALNISDQAFAIDSSLEIVREYGEDVRARVDGHKLIEILVNLIQNARQAMRNAELGNKRLTLRIRHEGISKVVLEVEDSGEGISEDNLLKIFSHGFTTKKDGHGFGLHMAANAATEMRGQLRVLSDGAGRGATFALELPFEAATTAGTIS